MNRRQWLLGSAAAGLFAPGTSAGSPTRLQVRLVRLRLRHTWTTTMSSSEYRDTVHVAYTRDGVTGRGEGAPIRRYRETPEGAKRAVESIAPLVTAGDPWKFDKLLRSAFATLEDNYAARAAVDIALMDWIGQKLGVPLYTYFGLDPADAPVTSFSIGIDKPDVVRRKVREAEPYPILKIKVGLDSDEEMVRAVRSVTDKPIRVDANEGWKDRETAARRIEWLLRHNVEFIEQPMPADRLEDVRWLRERFDIPIIADEAVLHPGDIPKLAEAYDGVNIKLDKAGGILEAWRMIQIAKALGMKTMLGCMISSSVSVTAAAHLSPLVDYADLDGNLLIANDPYRGVLVKEGKLVLPHRPGLGLVPA